MDCRDSQTSTVAVLPLLPTGFRLRPAQVGDGRQLHISCYPHLPYPRFLEQFQRVYNRQLASRGLYLLAEAGSCDQAERKDLVGCGQLLFYQHSTEIAELFVLPAYRNRGIGTALLQQLLAAAAAAERPAVEIGVTRENEAAQRLYQRLGFAVDREIIVPGKQEKAIILLRELL